MTNRHHTVLYTGVTGDVFARAQQHKCSNSKSFTGHYHVNKLVYYEEFAYPDDAIRREKQIKAGPRLKKIRLIDRMNPSWHDLSLEANDDESGRNRS